MKNNNDYMESIYNLLNSPEEEFDDGITYIGSPDDEDEFFYEDELAWADNITYLDEPDDDEFNLDLGEGFIPLPQGDIIYEKPIVIDENYMLDEYEVDLTNSVSYLDLEDEVTEMTNVVKETQKEVDINLDLDKAESIIKLPKQQTVAEELQVLDITPEDDRISKDIAREHLDMINSGSLNLASEDYGLEDDTSWVDDDDLFGSDISVIIAEDPNKDVEEEDFVDGSFEDWLAQNN
jgi:hypothetical protein